jgi:hypothetical protein
MKLSNCLWLGVALSAAATGCISTPFQHDGKPEGPLVPLVAPVPTAPPVIAEQIDESNAADAERALRAEMQADLDGPQVLLPQTPPVAAPRR